MKIEYLHDISDGGRYKDVISNNLIRLYDFNQRETSELADLIYQKVVVGGQELDLSAVDFIKQINCTLILQPSIMDKGIMKTNKPNIFSCNLTQQSYQTAIEIIKAVDHGYNWLCDTSDDEIDFLYSAGGTW